MRPFFTTPLFALLALLPTSAWAATDSQIWAGLSATEKLGNDWRAQEEFVSRFSDHRGGLYELEMVGMLGYKPSKNVTLAGGYVYNPQYSHGDRTATEHRAREQVTVDNVAQIGRGKLSVRWRMEQRWRDQVSGTGLRGRPYIKYSLPLGGKISLNLSNETFVNFNTTPFQRQAGIDRMRNLIAISTAVSKKLSIDAGYMNQHGFVRGGPDTSDHIASLSLSLNL
ncbi:MAG: DUF2490 domain-containing protein [Sphingomicrobium sp.]